MKIVSSSINNVKYFRQNDNKPYTNNTSNQINFEGNKLAEPAKFSCKKTLLLMGLGLSTAIGLFSCASNSSKQPQSIEQEQPENEQKDDSIIVPEQEPTSIPEETPSVTPEENQNEEKEEVPGEAILV